MKNPYLDRLNRQRRAREMQAAGIPPNTPQRAEQLIGQTRRDGSNFVKRLKAGFTFNFSHDVEPGPLAGARERFTPQSESTAEGLLRVPSTEWAEYLAVTDVNDGRTPGERLEEYFA